MLSCLGKSSEKKDSVYRLVKFISIPISTCVRESDPSCCWFVLTLTLATRVRGAFLSDEPCLRKYCWVYTGYTNINENTLFAWVSL